jgi:hypothetical protein
MKAGVFKGLVVNFFEGGEMEWFPCISALELAALQQCGIIQIAGG